MRTLLFEQISDSRFSGSEKELDAICGNVLSELSSLTGVTVTCASTIMIRFPKTETEDSFCSWRKRFFVQKSENSTTWNDVLKSINRVKASSYGFVQNHKF
jgi:hypothetical protein